MSPCGRGRPGREERVKGSHSGPTFRSGELNQVHPNVVEGDWDGSV